MTEIATTRQIAIDSRLDRAIDHILRKVRPGRVLHQDTRCTLYRGKLTPKGYAALSIAGRSVRAHRAVWTWFHRRQIPAGLVIDHAACGQRHCVNPLHLQVCTPAENSSRNAWARKRECEQNHPLSGGNVVLRFRKRLDVLSGGRPRVRTVRERQCRACSKFRKKRFRTKKSLVNAVRRALGVGLDPVMIVSGETKRLRAGEAENLGPVSNQCSRVQQRGNQAEDPSRRRCQCERCHCPVISPAIICRPCRTRACTGRPRLISKGPSQEET